MRKTDSWWEPAVKRRELSSLLCDDLDGWDGVGEAQEGGYLCMHMADSLHCIAETNTFKAIILNKKLF